MSNGLRCLLISHSSVPTILSVIVIVSFFFYSYADHRNLHSFPTRRSSDLRPRCEPVWQRVCGFLVANPVGDRKSTRLNSSHVRNSYAVLCLTKKIRVQQSVNDEIVASIHRQSLARRDTKISRFLLL